MYSMTIQWGEGLGGLWCIRYKCTCRQRVDTKGVVPNQKDRFAAGPHVQCRRVQQTVLTSAQVPLLNTMAICSVEWEAWAANVLFIACEISHTFCIKISCTLRFPGLPHSFCSSVCVDSCAALLHLSMRQCKPKNGVGLGTRLVHTCANIHDDHIKE